MTIEFNGASWALGCLCAAVYFGHLSPWWLLITPLFVVSFTLTTIRLYPR